MKLFLLSVFFVSSFSSCKNENSESLFLINDTLRVIPDTIFKKHSLSKLVISKRGFTIYPPLSTGNEKFNKLMPLENLPDRFDNFPYLKSLSIEGTSINSLPESIFKLHSLETLNVSFNKHLDVLSQIDQIRALRQLKYLNILETKNYQTNFFLIRKSLWKGVFVEAFKF